MKEFWKKRRAVIIDVLTRAIRTMAQTAVGAMTGSALLSDVNWRVVLSSAAFAGIMSLLMSVDRITAPIVAVSDNPTE